MSEKTVAERLKIIEDAIAQFRNAIREFEQHVTGEIEAIRVDVEELQEKAGVR